MSIQPIAAQTFTSASSPAAVEQAQMIGGLSETDGASSASAVTSVVSSIDGAGEAQAEMTAQASLLNQVEAGAKSSMATLLGSVAHIDVRA
jgi:hypothetical protein